MGSDPLHIGTQCQCADCRQAVGPIRAEKTVYDGSRPVRTRLFACRTQSELPDVFGGTAHSGAWRRRNFYNREFACAGRASEGETGKALGLLGAMNGMAAVLGPNIGSFLLDVTGSWHWLFLINLPIAAALVVCGGLFIAETKEPEAKRLDLAGTMLLSLAILSCMIGITNLDGAKLSESIMDVKVYGYLLGAALLFLVLLKVEKRVENRGRSDSRLLAAAK